MLSSVEYLFPLVLALALQSSVLSRFTLVTFSTPKAHRSILALSSPREVSCSAPFLPRMDIDQIQQACPALHQDILREVFDFYALDKPEERDASYQANLSNYARVCRSWYQVSLFLFKINLILADSA